MCFGETLSQEVRRMRSGEFGEGWRLELRGTEDDEDDVVDSEGLWI